MLRLIMQDGMTVVGLGFIGVLFAGLVAFAIKILLKNRNS